MKSLTFIDDLKLRASYGLTGNFRTLDLLGTVVQAEDLCGLIAEEIRAMNG